MFERSVILLDMTNAIKPSLLTWVTVGVMAITFIVLMKYIVNAYPNPVTAVFKSTIDSV